MPAPRSAVLLRLFPVLSFCLFAAPAGAEEAAGWRLVPYPKQVRCRPGEFRLDRPLIFETPRDLAAVTGPLIENEFRAAGLPPPQTRQRDGDDPRLCLRVADAVPSAAVAFRAGASAEDYAVRVQPDAIAVDGAGAPGVLHGAATLCQLLRANRRGTCLPCLEIDDWPSLRWRAFQDDLTRGPSTRLDQLKRDVARGASLKLNVFTYYMQHQFAFRKHPKIGPSDGSLTPDELAALVAEAKPRGVHVLGNQQSFAHMQHLLALPEYAALREDERTLSPVKEETYQLLDDLYSEVLPLLDFEFFNVCCDETWGLGTKGPSQELARQIGPGGVYVRHIRRVHDLVHGKYGKRMMMWGDIILNYPERLGEIPKNVIMLTWGYDARPSFEEQIVPFARSGYEFFVCPGVNNWSRVLPDFGCAAVNIQHFVRDGAKHGASGMLNTSWDDDGENLNAPNWYGFAWGAECAWNAAATSRGDFDRRVGAVLFGEPQDHFGQAIASLSDPRLGGLSNRVFWTDGSPLVRQSEEASFREAGRLARQALEHLEACRQQAAVDAELLDAYLFGTRRLEFYYQRLVERIEAARVYAQVLEGKSPDADLALQQISAGLRAQEQRYREFRDTWERLWLSENKPFALAPCLARYDQRLQQCRQRAEQVEAARQACRQNQPLPAAVELGLAMWSRPKALARPAAIASTLGPYQDYFLEFAFDGNPETFFWSNRGLQPEDTVTLTFDQPASFAAVALRMGTSRYRQEFVHGGLLEISPDGKAWEKAADLNAQEVRVPLPDKKVKALRLRALGPQVYWLIIREIVLEPRGT